MAPVMFPLTVALAVRSPSARSPKFVHQLQNGVLVLPGSSLRNLTLQFRILGPDAGVVEIDLGQQGKEQPSPIR